MTDRVSSLAVVLLRSPDARHYSYDLSTETGVAQPIVCRVLTRLITAGWLVDGHETEEEAANPDFPRRYYRLTPKGKAMMADLAVVST
ncbi:hypothetical protein EV383_4424 [Pseudonocardia sediminis]|uniref:PadR family transcriptional regulator n=1 Tax=Pseudonocardia sediminis TaxID=1397368 RepID=A0A4Q7V4G3_PSEST|nr:MarR family winged helix-turn-helix transcriptional regulator [Pseudonocardia sediminis]RZT87499.1 hypothetical protein EV383_4424 [Pseudonocardia sediminis]